jgi:cytosine/adenosine deaminase-related metal-dependent hydrolase
MFKFFKQKSAAENDKLYRITLHVERGTNTEMPTNLVEAYVPVFVGADGHEAAAFKAVAEVRRRGFSFIDIADGQIYELDPYRWDAFVMDAWADFVTEFPTQSKVIEALRTNFVFIGPYASYEAQAPQTR